MKVTAGFCAGLLVILLFAAVADAQSPSTDRSSLQGTQARGYWVDPATGLMWAGRDNGKDVSWKKAVKYCRNLRLAGYSDWRLANLPELAKIFDKTAEAPGFAGMHGDDPFPWHVKGNLFLSGDEWSSNFILDDRGRPSGYYYYFDFNEGRADEDPSGWPYSSTGMRALCVRGSEK